MLISLRNGMLAGGASPAPAQIDAVCFENVGSTTGTVELLKGSSAPTIDLQKSYDGIVWNVFDDSNSASVLAGGKVYIRAGQIGQYAFANSYNENGTNKLSTSNSSFKVSGDITTLLHQTPTSVLTSSCNFCYLFKQSSIVDASQLQFPDTTASICYFMMFQGCTSLVHAPVLPAMTLNESCYNSMFQGCTSLIAAPALPAMTVVSHCYNAMFQGCTSLTTAPAVLPATTLGLNCYNSMFMNCTSLTTAPTLPATILADGCYYQMFRGCSNLASVNVAFTSWNSVNNQTTNWVYGVASTGTFTCPAALGTNETITRGDSNCPTNWTVVNT